jgi:hypothetical protein
MLTPPGTAPERPIWQAPAPPPVSVPGLHETDVTVTSVFTAFNRVRVCEVFWLGALTNAVVLAETAAAEIVKVALVKPAPIVMDGGTVRLGLDEVSNIRVLNGAGLCRLRVQVAIPGVWTAAGAHTMPAFPPADAIVSTVERTTDVALANMVAMPPAAPTAVVAVTVAEVLPAGIRIAPGKLTCWLLVESATVMPPVGAALVNETVQALDPPGRTVAGLQSTEARVAGPLGEG